jgi:signal transduction histidine kinase
MGRQQASGRFRLYGPDRLSSRLQGLLEPRSERVRTAVLMTALFVAYVFSARLGIDLPGAHGVVTPVWAPTGIALVGLVLYGPGLWPAVALGAIVANSTSGASGPEAVLISVGNTLEAIVGSMLLRRVEFRPALDRVRDVFALVLFGAIVSTAIAASNGVTTLWALGDISGSDYPSEWLLWWIGDGMGDLIVAPLLFVLWTRPWRHLDATRRLEALAVLALLVSVSAAVFLGGLWRYPHMLFPLLIWSVLRFKQLGAVTSSFVVAAFAVAGAVHGTTPLGNGGTTEILQILEALTGGVAFSLLILGAVLAERAKAESDLAGAHASLAEAQELAHIGSWEWDIPSNRITWSDELYRLYELEPQSVEIDYETYVNRVHPEDRELVRRSVSEATAQRRPFAFEHRIQLSDERIRWVQGRGQVIVDEAGTPVRMVGTSQEITERKRVDELRDSILAAVSHELRTPLTSIIGFAVTLKERSAGLEEQTRREMIDHLAAQANKLGQLLSDLLDIDRLRRGFVQPSMRATDVGELVHQIAREYSSTGRDIKVEAESAIAEVDAPKVERIVDNLLANAVAYTAVDSEIAIRVENKPEGVLISVDDRGPGVPEEERTAIFEIFNRGSGSLNVSGTGIGLSLVAQFTALHGGRAWVEDNPGGGASFKVFLPARPAR